MFINFFSVFLACKGPTIEGYECERGFDDGCNAAYQGAEPLAFDDPNGDYAVCWDEGYNSCLQGG